jgi:hypothetical protein
VQFGEHFQRGRRLLDLLIDGDSDGSDGRDVLTIDVCELTAPRTLDRKSCEHTERRDDDEHQGRRKRAESDGPRQECDCTAVQLLTDELGCALHSIMRHIFVSLVALVCASTILAAQSTKEPKPITLSGCVEQDEKKPDEITLTDAKAKKTYRLTGSDMREYVGRRVQIDGGLVIKGVKISGGLQPNPNIAAQAGALDPSRAAVQAATSGTGTRPQTGVQEFRVQAIRSTGPCD